MEVGFVFYCLECFSRCSESFFGRGLCRAEYVFFKARVFFVFVVLLVRVIVFERTVYYL